MKVKFKKLVPHAIVPKRATDGSNGYDLSSAETESILLKPGEKVVISTGIAIALPENICGEIVPRSGLAFKYNLTVINSPGTVDSDYRGEIKVGIRNFGKTPFVFHPGDRIAQIKFVRTEVVEFEEVEMLSETDRGNEGFGSTGLTAAIEKVRGGEAPIPFQGFA